MLLARIPIFPCWLGVDYASNAWLPRGDQTGGLALLTGRAGPEDEPLADESTVDAGQPAEVLFPDRPEGWIMREAFRIVLTNQNQTADRGDP
jgi:hypothetical protein